MDPCPLNIGDVVQINPATKNEIFGACLMVVTEPKSFGAQGYILVPGKGMAFLRPEWADMELVGRAVWIRE